MNCAITVEQQLKFHKKVFGDLREMVEKSLPFDLQSYATDVFNTINSKTGDPILAQSYIQLLPTVIIQTAAFDKELSRLIKDKYSDLVDKQDLFDDFTEIDKYINPSVSEEVIQQIKDDIQEKSETSKVIAVPLTDEQILSSQRSINEFVHKPDSALTTTGQQGLIVKGKWTNIPNPEESFYYDFLTTIGDALDQRADITGEDLTINNHTGFKLKIIQASIIPDDKLRESTKRLLSGNELDRNGVPISAEKGRELHNKGISVVVTDNNDNILFFDNDYNVTDSQKGKPVYFHTRSPYLAASGRYSINSIPGDPGSLQTPEEIARNKNREIWERLSVPQRNVLIEQEDAAQQAQLAQLYKIRQFVNESPENSVIANLAGVSRGFVELDFDKWIPTTSINFEESSIKFDPIIPLRAEKSLGEDSMGLYIRRPYGKSIPLKPINLTDEQVDRVTSLLFDELYIDTPAGSQRISPAKIKQLVESFVFTGPEGIQLNIRNNELGIRVNSIFIDTRNPESAKATVRAKLTEGYATVAERSLAAKEGREPRRNPNFRHNYGTVNFDRNLINQGYYESFKIEGNKVIIEEANYLEFIRENTITNVRPNEENKIVPLNGYIKFDLPEHEKSRLGLIDYSVPEPIAKPAMQPNTTFDADRPLIVDDPITVEDLERKRRTELELAEREWFGARDSKGLPTYSLQPIEQEINKRYDDAIKQLDQEPTPSSDQTEPLEDNRSLDDKLNDLELDKSIHISNKATKKQIEAAKKWYDQSSLSKYFPYEKAFDIVNSNAFATWTTSGIRLYAGSNYTDLYHEAWHGFSQFFLTKAEKTSLYNELKGSSKKYAKLANIDLEEILAEDFRKYVLSGGKKVLDQRSQRNSIFRRIWNFLKSLFTGVTIQDSIVSQSTVLRVKELYDNLYLGNLNQYNPSSFNIDFGLLNKGIIPVGEEKRVGLNYEESMLVVNTIDSMISQFINDRNQLSGSNKWTSVIFRQPEAVLPLIYESVKKQFEKLREDFISEGSLPTQNTSITMQPHNIEKILQGKKTTTLRSSSQASSINIAVGESKLVNFGGKDFVVTNRGNLTIDQAGGKNSIVKSEGLSSESEFMFQQTKDWVNGKGSLFVYDIKPAKIKSSITQGNIRILDEVLANFGDVTASLTGEQESGVISYHLNKSQYLQFNPKNVDPEEIGTITSEDIEATRFDRKGNEVSMKELAANEVLYLVKSIRTFDIKGNPIYNRLGVRELADFRLTWARLIKALEGSPSPQDMYEKLLAEAVSFPVFKEIIEKLGSPSTTDKSSFNLWTKFWQTFNLANIPLYQVNVVEINEQDEVGEVSTIYKVLVGQASAVFRNVERDFKSYFVTTESEKFIKSTRSGNILDTKGILDKYKNGTRNKEFEFIRDLGMPITDVPQVREGIRKLVNTGFIYDKLLELDRAGIPIKDVIQALREETVIYNQDGSIQKKLASENTNLNTIMNLQVRFSGVYSNAAVTNAEGNAQYEQSLNSSLTVLQSAINNASNFDELVKIPHMSHLALDRNPFSRSSIWLNSIFDMKNIEGGRPRRKDVKFEIVNLGGVQTVRDDVADYSYSTGTADADKYTKLLQDIYLTIHTGRPAVMTHADKGTVLSMRVSKVNSPVSNSSDLYVDTEDFFITPPGSSTNNGYTAATNLIIPYIQSEIDRINRVINDSDKAVPGYTTPDSKGQVRGASFTIFDDILPDNVKEELLDIQGPIENYFRASTDESRSLYRAIQSAMADYFNNSIADTKLQLGDMLYLDNNIKDKVRNLAKDPRGKYNLQDKITDTQVENVILESYVVNTFIHNIESLSVVYGDLALYNMGKEEFHKRNAAIASTGYLFRTDQAALDYINNTVGRGYRKSLGLPERTFNGSFNSVIFRENTVQSVLIPEYTEALKSNLKSRYPKKSDQDIAKQVDEILAPYRSMDEGDAQGWITIDAYRIAMELEGKWTRSHEALYEKIIKGEPVTALEITEFFPPRKYQYFGPLLESTGLPITAFHKFSLFPLIPSVIKGKNMQILQDNLERNEVDYALFQSGSKVGTIVNPSTNKPDVLYSDAGRRTVATDEVYTKNTIRLEFLKDQLDIAPKFKGKVIFSTQLRKLIEEGLVEGGVPVDFKPELSVDERRKEWFSIAGSTPSETEGLRNKASEFYGKYKRYEDNISKLIEVKKLELLKEAGWSFDSNGNPTGDITKLLEMVKVEMSRQDLGDNEIDFLQTNSDGTLKYDLSISLSADKIERVLTALVNNRLIRQKVNGEGLVQLSNSLMEATNPTDDDRAKWGTGDLKSYRKDPKTGKTLPMEVKLALQGNFEYLLNLRHMDGKRAGTLERLNQIIQDPEWRSNEDNLRLISMVAVRIPVQGLNSMEFMEVKEFLPKEAGNIIVPPSEIVAKSGSDFDIDKLTVMMPSIGIINSRPEVYRSIPITGNLEDLKARRVELRKQRKNIKDKYNEIFADRKNSSEFALTPEQIVSLDELRVDFLKRRSKLNRKIDSLNQEWLELFNGDKNYYTVKRMTAVEQALYNLEAERDNLSNDQYETYLGIIRQEQNEKVNTERDKELSVVELELANVERQLQSLDVKATENELIFNIREILEMPHNFVSLITPNDTNLVKPLADQLKNLRAYDPTKGTGRVSPTRVLEPAYNIYKHESNSVGKQTLGLGAVDNTYNTVFNRVGAVMNPTWSTSKGSERRADILLPHNKLEILQGEFKGNYGISLSHLYDANGENKIADVINQLMNGWVDVAKDAWIFDIQGNKEVTPTLLFMIQAGVPLKTAVYFVSNSLVKKYVEQRRKMKSVFSRPLSISASEYSLSDYAAKMEVLKTFFVDADLKSNALYKKTTELVNEDTVDDLFSEEQLLKNITNDNSEESLAAFLHFLELEELAKGPRELKLKLNYDTSRSTTLFDAQRAEANLQKLAEETKIPSYVVSSILEDSPIGSFRIQPFQLSLWGELFKLRNHSNFNKFLIDKLADSTAVNQMKKTFGDEEVFINQFRNDFVVAMFLGAIKNFDLDSTVYKGVDLQYDAEVKEIKHSSRGALVTEKNGKPVILIDKEVLDTQFNKMLYSGKKSESVTPINRIKYNKYSYESQELAPVNPSAFIYDSETRRSEYYNFVIEREYLRYQLPVKEMAKTLEFKNKFNGRVNSDLPLVVNGIPETREEFETRIAIEVYEEILRDKALDNILNFWKLFRSPSNIAAEFTRIKETYPDMMKEYSLVRDLIVNEGAGISNLKLKDSRLTGDDVNTYYENMLRLSDSNIEKIPVDSEESKLENDRISEFFSRLPLFAMLQSGLNATDSLSIGRIMPSDKISRIMQVVMDKTITTLNDEKKANTLLDKFWNKFIQHNSRGNIKARRRIRDYVMGEKQLPNIISKGLEEVSGEPNMFTFFEADGQDVVNLIENHPDVSFVLDEGDNDVNTMFYNKRVYKNRDNMRGIVTRDSSSSNASSLWTDQTFEINKARIDESLSRINDLYQSDKKIAFSKLGYGQYMLDPISEESSNLRAPKTFSYLSRMLYEMFGYINPRAKLVTDVQNVINQQQEDILNISDVMMRNKIRSEVFDVLYNKDNNCQI